MSVKQKKSWWEMTWGSPRSIWAFEGEGGGNCVWRRRRRRLHVFFFCVHQKKKSDRSGEAKKGKENRWARKKGCITQINFRQKKTRTVFLFRRVWETDACGDTLNHGKRWCDVCLPVPAFPLQGLLKQYTANRWKLVEEEIKILLPPSLLTTVSRMLICGTPDIPRTEIFPPYFSQNSKVPLLLPFLPLEAQ